MINMPEVSIIGINKAIERAVVVDGQITVRLMMNLSSSFDHRFVDGYDCGLDDPGAQGSARAAGDDLHRLTRVAKASPRSAPTGTAGN